MQISPLWLDRPDALNRISAARASGQISDAHASAASDLAQTGLTIIRRVAPASLCDQVADDFASYLRKHPRYAARCVDAQGRHLRFVNFHRASQATLELGNLPQVMSLLDFLFDRPAGIYTSLLFEYGSQQPIHRDSPFFHTFPVNYFMGVWFALEDIHPDSGPLIYVPRGHRFEIDHRALFQQVKHANPHQSGAKLLDLALQNYYSAVTVEAEKVGSWRSVVLRKGDCVIWHPMLPHGGEKANNPMSTRKSIVFHCAPVDMQVYQHDVFFTADVQPPPRYEFGDFRGRQYALAGEPSFQIPGDASKTSLWSKRLVRTLYTLARGAGYTARTP